MLISASEVGNEVHLTVGNIKFEHQVSIMAVLPIFYVMRVQNVKDNVKYKATKIHLVLF